MLHRDWSWVPTSHWVSITGPSQEVGSAPALNWKSALLTEDQSHHRKMLWRLGMQPRRVSRGLGCWHPMSECLALSSASASLLASCECISGRQQECRFCGPHKMELEFLAPGFDLAQRLGHLSRDPADARSLSFYHSTFQVYKNKLVFEPDIIA